MSQINLKVKSDFDQASKDLKQFGNTSEAVRKQVEKFQETFKGEQIDKFIDKNRRLGAAVQSTRGPVDSLIAHKELVINQQVTKLTEDATKAATGALKALGAAAVAAGAALIANAADIARIGDELAKTSAKVGVGVEALQELAFAAERSGLPADQLGNIFQKLNKNVGELQNGTGALTTFLKNNNTELLNQLQNVNDSEQAFNLLVDAIAESENDFEQAALAQAAFGRTGQDIINFAEQGSEEIARLREEAREYGLISAQTAKDGEEFVDAQRNLAQATLGLRAAFAEDLLPVFTDVINGFADFISDTDQVKATLEALGLVLAGVTGGLVAFLVVTKGAAAIQALSTAFTALNAAIAANPLGAIAVVITTILIPAVILLIKNWDEVVIFIQETIAVLKENFNLFAANLQVVWTVAISNIRLAFISLGQTIVDAVLGAIQNFLELAAKLPFVGEQFQGLANSVEGLRDTFREGRDAAIEQRDAAIESAESQRDAVREATQENIAQIRREADVRREELEKRKEENKRSREEGLEEARNFQQQLSEIEAQGESERLKVRLEVLNNQDSIIYEERLTTFSEFLDARLEQEQIAGEQRIEFLQSELSRIQELENISNEERIVAEQAVADKIRKIDQETAAAKAELREQELAGTANLFGALSGLIASKSLAAAEAAINTGLAFTKTLADGGPFPLNAINAAAILATGIKTQIDIANTPIPSAQTGTGLGGFTIPDTPSTRTDNVGIVAGPGETVNVTPRGESARGQQRIVVEIGREAIIDVVNDGIDSGDVRITTDNIQGGLSA